MPDWSKNPAHDEDYDPWENFPQGEEPEQLNLDLEDDETDKAYDESMKGV